MNRNGEQVVPDPVSKRWEPHWQHEPVHHNVNADPVQDTGHHRMNREKFDLSAGQVKKRYNYERNKKMKRQTEPSRNQSAVERVRAEQSSGDSLQSALRTYATLPPDHERGRDVQNTNDQTGREDCAKRFGFFHVIVAELTQESRKSGSKTNSCGDNGPVNLWTLMKKEGTQDKRFVAFPVFLDSRFVVIS